MNVNISEIKEWVNRRSINQTGVELLKNKIQEIGFLENNPVTIVSVNGHYRLIDGKHRIEACKLLGIDSIPAIIKEGLSDIEQKRLATNCNTASETVIPTTFVDNAEFIWREQNAYTNNEIAGMLNWSESKVKQYSALKGISSEVWKAVTENEAKQKLHQDSDVTTTVTNVTFSEGILRSIISLNPEQQIELVTDLAKGEINKGKFKHLAEAYKVRNQLVSKVKTELSHVDSELVEKAEMEILSGKYDKNQDITGLIQSIRDQWEQKNSIRLIHGDFYEQIEKIASDSIDLIITDPPYNIAKERVFDFKNENGEKTRSDISQDFGEWDKIEKTEFIKTFQVWAEQFKRILKEKGSGYIFTSDRYFSYLRDAFEQAGFKIKTPLFWCKTNPGTQVIKTNFKSAVEMVFFFTKCESGHTFNWQGENEMRNFFESPICQGNARLKDSKGNTLHPTQKPQRVIRHLMEISSNMGDTVFDGFMGVGTTARVAKERNRKFIGIEKEEVFFNACK